MSIHRKVNQPHGTVSIDGKPKDVETHGVELIWWKNHLGRGIELEKSHLMVYRIVPFCIILKSLLGVVIL
jgi:hypothetical protein